MDRPGEVVDFDDAMRIFEEIREELLKEGIKLLLLCRKISNKVAS